MRRSKRQGTLRSILAHRGQRRSVILCGGHLAIELKIRVKIKPAFFEAANPSEIHPEGAATRLSVGILLNRE
jgi:hypothetical protein